MQAKDIPDEAVLGLLNPQAWTMIWEILAALPDRLGGVVFPDKVVQAKLRRLKKRGLIHGCDCGCRGDWHLPCGDKDCS